MSLTIRSLTASGFAGEVSDVDLTKPLSRQQIQAIDDGMDQYGDLGQSHDHAPGQALQ